MNLFKKTAALVFTAFLICLPPAEGAETGGKYALLIGINDYKDMGMTSLKGCVNDVELVSGLLRETRFGFREKDIKILRDGEATHTKILDAIDALASKVSEDDVVYIHYSGHGARAKDENGDEKNEGREYDSTFITSGSRTSGDGGTPIAESKNLDDYDILDDELNAALSRLSARTRNVVFVADSCFAGTVSRGTEDGMAERSGPEDARRHPAGSLPRSDLEEHNWIAVGAAQDTEKSLEFTAEDGKTHGVFTWFWVKALKSSATTDTWQTVFERTHAMMRSTMRYISLRHTPLIEGDPRAKIFGGKAEEAPRYFTVRDVDAASQKATINAGSLAGIAANSEFRLRGGNIDFIVSQVSALESKADIKGDASAVEDGDLVEMTKWVPSGPRIKIALQADDPEDEKLYPKLRALFSGEKLPAYELADSPADLTLWLVRPKRGADGKAVMAEGMDLPVSDEKAPVEVWLTNAGKDSPQGVDFPPVSADAEGLKLLEGNLDQLAKWYALRNMEFPGGGAPGVAVEYLLYAPASEEEWSKIPAERRLEVNHSKYNKFKLSRTVPAEDMGVFELNSGEVVIRVRAVNNTDEDYYIYAVNMTPGGKIIQFVPGLSGRSTRVGAKASSIVPGAANFTEREEYVRVFATKYPIRFEALTQPGFINRTKAGGRDLSDFIQETFQKMLYPTRADALEVVETGIAPADVLSSGASFIGVSP